MIIYLSSDHAGYYLKEKIKADFLSRGFLVEDYGPKNFDSHDDYPDYIYPCIKNFITKTNGNIKMGFAIVIGGSGTGEAIVSNRISGARAVIFNNPNLEIVKLGRSHNDANILSIGARFVTEEEAFSAVKTFMTTAFEGGRHLKRVLKIDMLM